MKPNVSSKLKKTSIIAILVILLTSLIINIYQQVNINNYYLKNSNLVENYVNSHEDTFANVFVVANTPILQYIKKPDNISKVIEGIEQSEFYYQSAADAVQNDPQYKFSGHGFQESKALILNGYISALKSYRTCITKNNIGSYGYNINQIISDLRLISNWLIVRNNKNNLSIYTDTDFYNELYKKLSCNDIKKYYFEFFSINK